MDCSEDNKMRNVENNVFPPEIWEMIFKKINNPVKLMNYQRVCKDWFKIIERILENHNKWMEICISHLSVEFIWRCIGKRFSTKIFKKDNLYESCLKLKPTIWRDIYSLYRKWQRTVDVTHSIDSIKKFPSSLDYEKISCIATWDDILAVGSSEGFIYFCKIYDLKNIFYIADHKNYVKQIEFWCPDKQLMLISTCTDARLKFWNILERQEIETNEYFAYIISISTDHHCYCEYRGIITNYISNSWNINKDSEYELNLHWNQSVISLYSNKNAVCLSISSGKTIMECTIMTTSANKHDNSIIFLNHSTIVAQSDVPFRFMSMNQFYRWDDQLAIGLSDKFIAMNKIGTDDTWITYNVFEYLHGIVTSVIFHINILILGLDSGALHIFRANHEDKLQNLCFKTCRSKKIILDNEPIIKINITETQNEPFIIAVTERNIHIIRFF
ncbi:hypothetical protein PV326_010462 [Microctonus aethiopoides]|nr:hypothetical protein PV326_010462 [Microctonus aethiopoides]